MVINGKMGGHSAFPAPQPAFSHHTIALAGNPNVGKSTVFNKLTGMNQHTGNWPGKTVTQAQGSFHHRGHELTVVDLPGAYSLDADSPEEEVTRDYICFAQPDVTVVVADATCLERNLNLALQVREVCPRIVLCVNLLDEAKKKQIYINLERLSLELGLPVVGASARQGDGLAELKEQIYLAAEAASAPQPRPLPYGEALAAALAPLTAALRTSLDESSSLPLPWLARQLIEADAAFVDALTKHLGYNICAQPSMAEALQEAREILSTQERPLRDTLAGALVAESERIYQACVSLGNKSYTGFDRRLDRIVTSRATGIPLMLVLLALVLWITISGANYPSAALTTLFHFLEGKLDALFLYMGAPNWLHGLLVEGMFRTLSWVVSVMLPPMAIFFPLFTLLEDSGYLPRVAFNMDSLFKRAGACGKQCLTTLMGFGCNACGVIGCRIINSPRERLIAMLTNNFVPCNGRFPTLIAIITMFFVGESGGLAASAASALLLTALIVLGIAMSLLVSRLLSSTLLSGHPSAFTLELPPYRRPQFAQVIVRSIFDRTLFVLGRAVSVAAPAGMVIWLLANIELSGLSLLIRLTQYLQPLGYLMGLDGVILLAFILGFPANEIVLPLILMGYLASGSISEFESLVSLHQLLLAHGWTWLTALNVMLFVLFHFPCATTLLTIRKESGGLKWTLLAFILPTACGFIVCSAVAFVARLFGLAP